MAINNLINLSDTELEESVWRYFTFTKFISLLTYNALWFSKLNNLEDHLEGALPPKVETMMYNENQKWKTRFDSPEYHKQIDSWPADNVRDGRELTVVNCWFMSANESKIMWDVYGKSEGVAIKSTIKKLVTNVYAYPEWSHIGKVKYVDHETYEMSKFEGSQAHKRAFLKDNTFIHEKELRIETMSLRTPWCVDKYGKQLSVDDCKGAKMNNFDSRGLYVSVNLKQLIDSIVIYPNAPEWFELLVKRIIELSNIQCEVKRSQLDKN